MEVFFRVAFCDDDDCIEIIFQNSMGMALCVGVGVDYAKVVVNILERQIEVHELSQDEWVASAADLHLRLEIDTPQLGREGDRYHTLEDAGPLLLKIAVFCLAEKAKSTSTGSGAKEIGDCSGKEDVTPTPMKGKDSLSTVSIFLQSANVLHHQTGALLKSNPRGLVAATLAPKLVFNFLKNGRLKVTSTNCFEIVSESDLLKDDNVFGWYHNDISFHLECTDRTAARLKMPRGSTMCNKCSYTKRLAAQPFSTRSKVDVLITTVPELDAEAISILQPLQQDEVVETTICNGFYFRDASSVVDPPSIDYLLFHPLHDIWKEKPYYLSTGLFQHIETSMEGTWIPLNKAEDVPYLLKIERKVKLHRNIRGEEEVLTLRQPYHARILVNHAMTHLASSKKLILYTSSS